MKSERRSKKRYPAKEGAIGAFFPAATDESFRVGQIVDISDEGLGLRYFSNEKGTRPPSHMDIFGSCRPLIYIGNVPSEVVHDRELLEVPGSNFRVRRCGVKFGELSKKQLSQLQHFMRNYVVVEDDGWKGDEEGCWREGVEVQDTREPGLSQQGVLGCT